MRKVRMTVAACCLFASATIAQELTPRACWPATVGTKVAVVGFSHSSGDTLFDPSIPLYGVDSKLNTVCAAYKSQSGFIMPLPESNLYVSGMFRSVRIHA